MRTMSWFYFEKAYAAYNNGNPNKKMNKKGI